MWRTLNTGISNNMHSCIIYERLEALKRTCLALPENGVVSADGIFGMNVVMVDWAPI
jgi:hypothetical protein